MTNQDLCWDNALEAEQQQPYFQQLIQDVEQARQQHTVYPAAADTFNALACTPLAQLQVVILGQDPYHGPGQAHGLSFSVPNGIKPPPSLVNIKKALSRDFNRSTFEGGDLTPWATQGVLLLNSVLTVEHNRPQSHAKLGWQRYTDAIIRLANQHPEPIVFLLWGAQAQKKSHLIHCSKHLILTAPHPSPLSAHRGFLDCQHFSQCNRFLHQHNRPGVDWLLDRNTNATAIETSS